MSIGVTNDPNKAPGCTGGAKNIAQQQIARSSRIWVIPLKRAVTLLTYEDDGGIHNYIFVTNTPWALWMQSIMDRFGLRAPYYGRLYQPQWRLGLFGGWKKKKFISWPTASWGLRGQKPNFGVFLSRSIGIGCRCQNAFPKKL